LLAPVVSVLVIRVSGGRVHSTSRSSLGESHPHKGRATNPSPSVLASLARALRCTDEERAHLFRVAGHAEPTAGTINRHVPPGVQRLLDRLTDVPVMVFDAAWQVVAANDLAHAQQLATLVDDLRAASPRFAELWRGHPIKRRMASRKTFLHPEVGSITLDCDVLVVQGSDLRLIVYTPAIGSPDADLLALLGASGQQSFSDLGSRAGRLDLIHHSYHYASTLVSGS